MKELLLIPENWCLRTGIRVVDPDGWDRKNYLISWQEPITRDEFLVRAASSSCTAWPSPLYDEKWKHEIHEPIAEHPEYDYCNCKDAWEHSEVLKASGAQDNPKDVETMSDNQDTPSSNPLLNILNDILKPKTSSTVDTDELMQASVQLHSMFEVFVKAGFTEAQALELVGRMLLNK